MKSAWWFALGLGFFWVSCGDSSTGDLFAPSGAGGLGGDGGRDVTTGGGTSSSSTMSGSTTTTDSTSSAGGNAGSTSVGAGGTAGMGAGGTKAGAGGAGMSGAAGAAAGRGGAAGAGGATTGGGMSGNGGRSGASGAAGSSAGGSGGSAAGGRGGGGTGGSSGAGGSGGSNPVDAGVDSGKGDIHCGTTFCTAMSEFCCVPENGPPRCVNASPVNSCPDSAAKVRCDDRTDCPIATQVCCAEPGTMGNGATAICRAAGTCNGVGRSEILCDPDAPLPCGPGGGTNVCRTDNQTVIPGYPSCH